MILHTGGHYIKSHGSGRLLTQSTQYRGLLVDCAAPKSPDRLVTLFKAVIRF